MKSKNYKLTGVALMMVTGLLMSNARAQTTTFDYSGDLQTYTVPDGVSVIEIEAAGAKGGQFYHVGWVGGVGGLGAQMTGTFLVTPGQVLNVLVGEKGGDGQFIGGGGGGTFVWDSTSEELLIAAGGGGGGGFTGDGGVAINGVNASVEENGTNGNSISSGAGVGGNGGTVPGGITDWASGGAGWVTNGADGSLHGCVNTSMGGQTPLTGGAGGIGGGDDDARADGGYGGGGGGNGRCDAVGGGGGGGYSGGGPGGEFFTYRYNGGGGGGSFNAGTNRSSVEGAGAGNGEVIISVKVQVEIKELSAEQVSTYPNPTTGQFNIELQGDFSYSVFNLEGQVVETGKGIDKETLDLSNLSRGIYLVDIRTATATKKIRLIKT